MTRDDFKTLLVAIDGSPESAAGIEQAFRHALPCSVLVVRTMQHRKPSPLNIGEIGGKQ